MKNVKYQQVIFIHLLTLLFIDLSAYRFSLYLPIFSITVDFGGE